MANINIELKEIKTAVFGKDVRSSIHDGIDKINKETENTTIVSVETEQRQGTLERQFDEQIKNMSLEDPSSAELVAAQTNTKTGENFPTIGRRLDVENKKVTQQLEQTENKRDFIRKGIFQYPDLFHKRLPFDIFIGFDGVVSHSFNFDTIDKSGQNIYLSWISGNDTRNGSTESLAVKTFTRAMELANASVTETVNVVLIDSFFGLANDLLETTYTVNKNINFSSNLEGGSYFYTGYTQNSFTWTSDGNIYKTSRSAVRNIYDYLTKNFMGFPTELRKVESLALCKSNKGTWYTDGTSVWVNRQNGKIPDNDIAMVIPFERQFHIIANGKKVFVDGVGFYMNHLNNQYSAFRITGNSETEVIFRNSVGAHSSFNGFHINRFKYCFMFNCLSYDCGFDGFNYHETGNEGTPYGLFFEYNCYSYNQGDDSNGTGNATSAHDGLHGVRLGCIGHDTLGPVLADVNGCKTISINCNMFDSLLLDKYETKSAFWFDNATDPTQGGMAWLINCGGGGNGTRTVNTDGSVPVFVKNLKGNNIPIELNYLD